MMADRLNLLWLQSGGCGGCTLSLLNAEQPQLLERLDQAGIRLLWHPSLSQASGSEALDILAACAVGRERLDLLCVEGSVMTGPHGSGRFHMLSGSGRPMMSWLLDLAGRARHVLAVGSCAAFGEPWCHHAELPDSGSGVGLVEAARGALGHWLNVCHGRIENYQIIAPTTWNFSPRDAAGIPGALEQALAGMEIDANDAMPVAVQHVVRSFDPCMVCTVH